MPANMPPERIDLPNGCYWQEDSDGFGSVLDSSGTLLMTAVDVIEITCLADALNTIPTADDEAREYFYKNKTCGNAPLPSQTKWFPIINGGYQVPWAFVEPHEPQAKYNHRQTLAELASRGGLDWTEIQAVLLGSNVRQDNSESAKIHVLKMLEAWNTRAPVGQAAPYGAESGLREVIDSYADTYKAKLQNENGSEDTNRCLRFAIEVLDMVKSDMAHKALAQSPTIQAGDEVPRLTDRIEQMWGALRSYHQPQDTGERIEGQNAVVDAMFSRFHPQGRAAITKDSPAPDALARFTDDELLAAGVSATPAQEDAAGIIRGLCRALEQANIRFDGVKEMLLARSDPSLLIPLSLVYKARDEVREALTTANNWLNEKGGV